jgi:hypothetical protein
MGVAGEALEYARVDSLGDCAAELDASGQHFFRHFAFADDRFLDLFNWTDKADVSRIRDELRTLGIVSKIPYKADHDTFTGRYARRGHKRISKYYE